MHYFSSTFDESAHMLAFDCSLKINRSIYVNFLSCLVYFALGTNITVWILVFEYIFFLFHYVNMLVQFTLKLNIDKYYFLFQHFIVMITISFYDVNYAATVHFNRLQLIFF